MSHSAWELRCRLLVSYSKVCIWNMTYIRYRSPFLPQQHFVVCSQVRLPPITMTTRFLLGAESACQDTVLALIQTGSSSESFGGSSGFISYLDPQVYPLDPGPCLENQSIM